MQLHELQPKHRLKRKKRVGRGGKRGTYSGRGMKGQKSRSGGRFQPIIRELIKRYPKLRGHRQKSIRQLPAKNQKSKIVVLNLEILEKKFGSEGRVSPETLFEKRLIHKIKGRVPEVKILGKGEITKNLTVQGCQISKQAKEKIEKAGGRVNDIPYRKGVGQVARVLREAETPDRETLRFPHIGKQPEGR